MNSNFAFDFQEEWMPYLLDDPYFAPLMPPLNSERKTLIESIYVPDNLMHSSVNNVDHRWMVTPLGKINLEKDKSNAVLMMSGGMAPVHEGHLHALEQAKKVVETQGYHVAGGYLTPDHDNYVSQKHPEALTGPERVRLCYEITSASEWIDVDPYAALEMSRDTNYTYLISRLENYLNYHFQEPLTVFYVYGGDNARFAATFMSFGQSVCVTRDNVGTWIQDEQWFNPQRTLIVEGNVSLSSAQVRAQKTIERTSEKYASSPYFVRQDAAHSSILKDVNKIHEFSQSITLTFLQYIQSPLLFKEVKENLAPLPQAISMDVYYPGEYSLEVSRHFSLGGGQLKALGIAARPDSASLQEQVEKIPPGEYTYLDDDIATGSTLRNVKSLLGEKRQIVNTKILTTSRAFANIVDERDFLLGSRHGGLVVTLPNAKIARVPYMYPWVNPEVRVLIPFGKAHIFSTNIWKINQNFHQGSLLTLSDIPEYSSALWYYLGFTPETLLVDICTWNLEKLAK